MKILFIVQGEGRGHLTQAISMEKLLRSNGHEVVEVLVGKSESRRLPGFFIRNIQAPVKQFISPNFLPTHANKRVNLTRSILYNLLKVPEYAESICYINRHIKETGAELVINFYELLTGLTYFFFRPAVPQICIGHQYLFLHNRFEFEPIQITQKEQMQSVFPEFLYATDCIGSFTKTGPLLPFHARRQSSAHQRGSSFVATRRIAAGKQTR
jgi:hypothetical protein